MFMIRTYGIYRNQSDETFNNIKRKNILGINWIINAGKLKIKQIEVLEVYEEDHTEGSLKVGVDSYEWIKRILLYRDVGLNYISPLEAMW